MDNWKKQVTTFLISQVVSLMGSMLVMYTIMWYVTLGTQSGSMMTIMVLCSFIPALIFAPFAGVWADRLNRKALMIVADLGIAAVTLVIAILFMFGIRDLWIIFVVSVIRSIGQAVHSPAVSAVYPQIVPEDKLLKVQSINQSIQSSSMVLMPMLAGLLFATVPIEYILLVDVVTAAIAVFILVTYVKIPKHKAELENVKIEYMKDIKSGIKYAFNHKFVLSLLIFGALFMFLVAAPSFLTYLQVARVFGAEEWRLAVLETLFGLGMVLGSLFITFWGGFKNRLKTFFMAYAVIGIGTALLGIPFDFWFYIGAWSLIGFFISISNPILPTLIQEKVEPEYLGRVFSVFGLISQTSMPLGMLLFGPLSDVTDVSLIILIAGICMILLALFPYTRKKLMAEGLPKVKPQEVEVTQE